MDTVRKDGNAVVLPSNFDLWQFFPDPKTFLVYALQSKLHCTPRDMIVVNRQSESDTVIDDKSQGIGLLWRHIPVVVMWWYS